MYAIYPSNSHWMEFKNICTPSEYAISLKYDVNPVNGKVAPSKIVVVL
jgi:hypothetical protein